VFYYNAVATLGSGAWMLRSGLHAPSWGQLALLLAIGASATFAQLSMTHAYRIGHTMAMSSLSYSTIFYASLFDLLFWHETLPLAGWLGMLLIVASGVLSLRLGP